MNLNQIDDETYEVAVELPRHKFKKMINQEFFDSSECSAIFKLHPNMLRAVLEKHLNGKEFFEMEEGTQELMLKFVVDLGYGVIYNVVLRLEEEVEEGPMASMKRKIEELEGRIDDLNEQIRCLKNEGGEESEESEDSEDEGEKKDGLFVLDCVKYSDLDDQFVMGFKWALANQMERERFMEVTKKYYVIGSSNIEYQLGCDHITRVEPLCLEISGNKAHIFGWFDVNKWRDGLEIPNIAFVKGGVPRILQKVSIMCCYCGVIKGVLMLCEDKLVIKGQIMKNCGSRNHPHMILGGLVLDGTDNKVTVSANMYSVIDTWFHI